MGKSKGKMQTNFERLKAVTNKYLIFEWGVFYYFVLDDAEKVSKKFGYKLMEKSGVLAYGFPKSVLERRIKEYVNNGLDMLIIGNSNNQNSILDENIEFLESVPIISDKEIDSYSDEKYKNGLLEIKEHNDIENDDNNSLKEETIDIDIQNDKIKNNEDNEQNKNNQDNENTENNKNNKNNENNDIGNLLVSLKQVGINDGLDIKINKTGVNIVPNYNVNINIDNSYFKLINDMFNFFCKNYSCKSKEEILEDIDEIKKRIITDEE